MDAPDTEGNLIRRLAELRRELFILESTDGNVLFPMRGFTSFGDNLDRIFKIKTRIADLEGQLAGPFPPAGNSNVPLPQGSNDGIGVIPDHVDVTRGRSARRG